MTDKIQKKIGFYPGSFDPITLGHLDIIARASTFLDVLVIGIGVHHGKKTLFDGDTRTKMIRDALDTLDICDFELITYDGLTVDAARAANANVIIRGLRNSTDFDYEMQMAGLNHTMSPELETVFLPSSGKYGSISGTFVRQIMQMGGDASPFVPPNVLTQFENRK